MSADAATAEHTREVEGVTFRPGERPSGVDLEQIEKVTDGWKVTLPSGREVAWVENPRPKPGRAPWVIVEARATSPTEDRRPSDATTREALVAKYTSGAPMSEGELFRFMRMVEQGIIRLAVLP